MYCLSTLAEKLKGKGKKKAEERTNAIIVFAQVCKRTSHHYDYFS